MAFGVRNDPHRKACRKDFRNRKTDSIDSDRTLRSHIAPVFFRQFDLQSEVCAFSIERDDARDTIYVALNEMSAEASVGAQRALQIHTALLPCFLQVRASN